MTDYESLAELRRALSADDPDRRANAYGDIMEHDVQPSQVLTEEPAEAVLSTLRQEKVLPEQAQTGMPTSEYRNQVVALLQDIKANTGGS